MKSNFPVTVIVVCGPTAIGKTAVSIQLAKALKTEIINADSRQVYQELNIGVAKPSEVELAAIKHHLIGHIPVTKLYGAGDFEKEALVKAQELFANHKTIILCGGTGMYIKAFCEGLDDLPGADVEFRKYLLDIFNKNGIESLQNLIQEKDELALKMMDKQNPQRLMRVLEIMKLSEKKYSELIQGKKAKRNFNIVKVGLNTNREKLYAKINERVDQMMAAGFLDEVKELVTFKQENALKTVGYKELFQYLDGEISLDKAVELIKQHTRNYAKRQLTWFNADKEITWFEPNQINELINFVEKEIDGTV